MRRELLFQGLAYEFCHGDAALCSGETSPFQERARDRHCGAFHDSMIAHVMALRLSVPRRYDVGRPLRHVA